jgi:hypothetical protein
MTLPLTTMPYAIAAAALALWLVVSLVVLGAGRS